MLPINVGIAGIRRALARLLLKRPTGAGLARGTINCLFFSLESIGFFLIKGFDLGNCFLLRSLLLT